MMEFLATLLEGAGCFFFKMNFKVNSFILLRWKKCVKLANESDGEKIPKGQKHPKTTKII